MCYMAALKNIIVTQYYLIGNKYRSTNDIYIYNFYHFIAAVSNDECWNNIILKNIFSTDHNPLITIMTTKMLTIFNSK